MTAISRAGAPLVVAGAAAVTVLATAPLASAGTRDQSQPRSEQARPLFRGNYVAQTFTVIRTGRLDRVDVTIDRDCELTVDVKVEIRTVSADGKPTRDVIASERVPAEQVPYLSHQVPVALNHPVEVAAGAKYAIVLDGQGSYCVEEPALPGGPALERPAYWWRGATGDGLGRPRFPGSPYAGGQAWESSGVELGWQAVDNFDFAFTTYVVDAPPLPPGSPAEEPAPSTGEPIPGTAGDTAAPETEIRKSPKRNTRNRRASVAFRSSEAESTFECGLDGRPFRPCGSPAVVRGLAPGRHRFRVRAVDAAGNTDPTPASVRWRVLG